MRLRGFRIVAASLVTAGVILIAAGGDQDMARGTLVAGLLCAALYLVIEWYNRRRS
jgi:hypothetical protein